MSRFVLQALGASDYGLYGVVGGVVALFAVISASMSSTTIRFLNIEFGKEGGDPNRIFNICRVTHILFAVLVFLLAETLGMFYVLNYLNVAQEKLGDAVFVFQVSTVVACIGIINVPYQGTFVAKEKFLHIAIIDIINALVKLGLVIGLLYYTGNKLRLYAFIMSFATLFSFVAYHWLCRRYWPDLVRRKIFRSPKEYKEILSFNNYTLLASAALMCRSQGSNILINFFFGTVVNGAFGIARTIQGFVEIFAVNFDTAAAPQITQSVGNGDIERASKLACRSCRMCQLLTLVVVLPLFVEMDWILHVWLGDVPKDTVLFCRVMLATIFVASTGGGLLRLKDALGKIKWFMLTYSFWYFITLPIGYILYKHGFPPVTVLALYVVTDIICRITQIILMKVVYKFDIVPFCKEAYTRPFIILTLVAAYAFVYQIIGIADSWFHLMGVILTTAVGAVLVWTIGLKKTERSGLLETIASKFYK